MAGKKRESTTEAIPIGQVIKEYVKEFSIYPGYLVIRKSGNKRLIALCEKRELKLACDNWDEFQIMNIIRERIYKRGVANLAFITKAAWEFGIDKSTAKRTISKLVKKGKLYLRPDGGYRIKGEN